MKTEIRPADNADSAATNNVLDLILMESTVDLQPGQVLFTEGDLGSCMYVVKTGALRIRSGPTVYEDVGIGGIVGEMALVEQQMPRSATVYALVASELVEVDELQFLALVEKQPRFVLTVMRVLSRRLRHMDRIYRRDDWP